VFDPILRATKDRLLEPVARRLPGAPPMAVTLVGLCFGVAAAVAGWQGNLWVGFALWGSNRVADGLDGTVARVHGKSTDLGGYIDLVADFVVYAAIPVGIALRPGADPELVGAALLLLAVFYVNAASWMVPAAILEKRRQGVAQREEPTSVVIPEGIVSGAETVVFYSLFFILPDHQLFLFRLMAFLTLLTVLQRLAWALRTFNDADQLAS